MKAAIAFPTPDTDNYNIWTLARAMDHGWMFRLPVWGRHGNGYIFDSDYINADQAKLEAEKYLGFEVDVGKTFKFDPGALENVWIKNCVAIGVSASFVEPMEASSIGTSIQQSFLLMHRLANYDDHVIKSYNKSVNDILENIRDFVILHYLTGKQSNEFWKDVTNLEIPDSLKYRLDLWKHKMPTKEDFSDLSNFILFAENNWTLVMQGLELFDKESIKNELQAVEPSMQQHALTVVKEIKKYENTVQTITHKEYIKSIREFKNDK
jgi:tryptophan halogenase